MWEEERAVSRSRPCFQRLFNDWETYQKKKKFFSDWELGDVDSLLQMVVRDGVGDNLR